jgi:hypothetical protein
MDRQEFNLRCRTLGCYDGWIYMIRNEKKGRSNFFKQPFELEESRSRRLLFGYWLLDPEPHGFLVVPKRVIAGDFEQGVVRFRAVDVRQTVDDFS